MRTSQESQTEVASRIKPRTWQAASLARFDGLGGVSYRTVLSPKRVKEVSDPLGRSLFLSVLSQIVQHRPALPSAWKKTAQAGDDGEPWTKEEFEKRHAQRDGFNPTESFAHS